MMTVRSSWNGDDCQRQVLAAGWDNIRRAAMYFLHQAKLTVSHGSALGKGAYKANPPPNAPNRRTGWGADHIQIELDQPNLRARVGLAKGAAYMLMLEIGTKAATIVPRTAKALSWVGQDGVRHFAKKVNRPAQAGRHWFMGTLTRFWGQISALAAGGGGSGGTAQ